MKPVLAPDGQPAEGAALSPIGQMEARIALAQKAMLRALERRMFLPEGGRLVLVGDSRPAPEMVGLSAALDDEGRI